MDTPMKSLAQIQMIRGAAAYIREKIQGRKPEVGIVLGSGLGKLADQIEDPIAIPYSELQGFPVSTAIGHKGNYIVGMLEGKCVVAMQGRIHYYEGYGMQKVVLPIRVMQELGIKYLFVSNAAGGTNLSYHVGDLMMIMDHINLLPNPLIGPNVESQGPRFPDMTNIYSSRLKKIATASAEKLGISLREGIYVAETGPSYETPAEYRMFRLLGGDVVGMSTVPEVIVAHHCGMEVFGMSIVTNQSNDLSDEVQNDAQDVVIQAEKASNKMTALFKSIIEAL